MAKQYEEIKILVPRFNEESGFYTTKLRSNQMSKIRAKNTKPELAFRKALWKKGIRYRVNSKKLPGKPDIAINKYKTIVFVDGAFWHGFDWENKRGKIKSNRGFWIPKIERNMQRDHEVNALLKDKGFTVFRFWCHDLKKDMEKCIDTVVDHVNKEKDNLGV